MSSGACQNALEVELPHISTNLLLRSLNALRHLRNVQAASVPPRARIRATRGAHTHRGAGALGSRPCMLGGARTRAP